MVKFLVEKGADLHLANDEGATPLIIASQEGHLEVVKSVVEKGAVVDQPANDGARALTQASFNGHLGVVHFLLSAGANINHLNTNGLSPLFGAAQRGHLDVVKLLVKKGANIYQASIRGVTPLHAAACWAHQEVVDFLMGKGAEFEARGTPAKICKCCGATDAKLKCSGCAVVYYCCEVCQKKDWKEGGEDRHKVQCKNLVEMKARYVEKAKKEIEEKIAEFGMQSIAGNKG